MEGQMADLEKKELFERIRRDNAERDRREALGIIRDVWGDLDFVATEWREAGDEPALVADRQDCQYWAAALAEALRGLGDE
jgi:hypothetical protein